MERRTPAQQAGSQAENLARSFLQRQGLTLISQNWLCRTGELDLVMLDADTVVFIEVRYRRHTAWGNALESVDFRKQARLSAAAQTFLQQHPNWQRHPCRFDVIAMQSGNPAPTLDWIKNAFDT